MVASRNPERSIMNLEVGAKVKNNKSRKPNL